MKASGRPAHQALPNDNDPYQVSHEELRKAHSLSKTGIVTIDTDGVIRYVNASALAVLDLPESEVTGKVLSAIYEDVSSGKIGAASLQQLKELNDHEFRINIRKGEKWVLASSLVHDDGKGEVRTYLFLRDISKLKKKEKLTAYLSQAAAELARARDTESALEQISRLIVPRFANWLTIDRLKDNKLELLVLQHEDPEKIKWAREYRQNYPPDLNSNVGHAVVIRSGEPGFLPVITEQMIDFIVADPVQRAEVKKIGMHSAIMAPMKYLDKVTGMANFISSDPERHFDEADLEFARNFANLIGLALENTRLNEEAANELKLREQSEARLRFLMDAIPHKVWTSAPDGRVTYYNRQWHDFTGVGSFEELRERIWDFIHPEDRLIAEMNWPKALEGGKWTESEQRFKDHDGVYRWHLSRVIPFRNSRGEIDLWVGTSTDVHEQKIFEIELAAANEELQAANEELGSSNEELATTNEELTDTQEILRQMIRNFEKSETMLLLAVNAARIGILQLELKTKRLQYNDIVTEMLGYRRPQGMTFTDMYIQVPAEHQRQVMHSIRNAASRRSEFDMTFPMRRFDDDRLVWMRSIGKVTAEGEETGTVFSGVLMDVTEQKRDEIRKNDFIGMVSHELKTPLTSLTSIIQLLNIKLQGSTDPFISVAPGKAERQVKRMAAMINSFLSISRLESGKIQVVKTRFELGELLTEVIQETELTAPTHRIAFQPNGQVWLDADRDKISSVISNLLSNAIKYSPGGTAIDVTYAENAAEAIVSVTDKGIGIEAENTSKLFERYSRVETDVTRYISGFGIGLYLCREILELHGGRIWVESEYGRGSTFYFSLPLAAD